MIEPTMVHRTWSKELHSRRLYQQSYHRRVKEHLWHSTEPRTVNLQQSTASTLLDNRTNGKLMGQFNLQHYYRLRSKVQRGRSIIAYLIFTQLL